MRPSLLNRITDTCPVVVTVILERYYFMPFIVQALADTAPVLVFLNVQVPRLRAGCVALARIYKVPMTVLVGLVKDLGSYADIVESA